MTLRFIGKKILSLRKDSTGPIEILPVQKKRAHPVTLLVSIEEVEVPFAAILLISIEDHFHHVEGEGLPRLGTDEDLQAFTVIHQAQSFTGELPLLVVGGLLV